MDSLVKTQSSSVANAVANERPEHNTGPLGGTQPGVGQKHLTPFQNFTLFLLLLFFVFSPFFPQSLPVVKSIKLCVSLTELHHLAAVKAKQTR